MTLIHKAATPTPILLAAGALFVIGFGVKTALVPLHTWLPDAHSQAPSGISAMLSGVVIEAGLVAMLRGMGPLAGLDGQGYPPATWGVLLIGLGALNMLVGNLMALRQKQVKRLLAYSSLSHVGYMLFGLGVALYAGQVWPARRAVCSTCSTTADERPGLPGCRRPALRHHSAAASPAGLDHRPIHGPLTIADLDGAAQRYPLAALAFSLAVLGLGGLPPLAGFMSKWQIFVGRFRHPQRLDDRRWSIFAALNSVLSLAYYAPLVNAHVPQADLISRASAAPPSRSDGPPAGCSWPGGGAARLLAEPGCTGSPLPPGRPILSAFGS